NECGQVVAAGEDNAAIVLAEAAAAQPRYLAGRAQLVQEPGLVVDDASGKDIAFEDGRRHGEPFELCQCVAKAVDATTARTEPLPMSEEPRGGGDGFDLLAEASE